MNLSAKLDAIQPDDTQKPFGPYEEAAIISLALDHPEFFASVGRFMKPEMFSKLETKYVIAEILALYDKFDTIPTRALLNDHIQKQITEDEPFEEVLNLVHRKSDAREVPMVKDTLTRWAKSRAFGLLYSDEAQDAYFRGDYQYLEEIFNQANRIADIGEQGFWFLENYQLLLEPSVVEHRTTGYHKLDKFLNNGGPSPKEVVCWLAATNVGKSIMLCNNAISSLTGEGPDGVPGQDVLLVTFELDAIKTAMRCLGITTEIKLGEFQDHQNMIERRITAMRNSYKSRLYIYELPPDECSVNHIYALLDSLKRTQGWKPDVVILDYLDLMISRVDAYNKDEYQRQKHVATEVRGLAKNEHLLVFTATQSNRSGQGTDTPVDLNQVAESYGKNMPLDYVVSLNQSRSQKIATPPRISLFIAKNRNGPKHEIIECTVEYDKMIIKEVA